MSKTEKIDWEAEAYPRFNRKRKKLSRDQKLILNEEIKRILLNPLKGEQKTGSLKGVWVEKFQVENDQLLVAYEIDVKKKRIFFMDVGQHENFYRELSKYRKSI